MKIACLMNQTARFEKLSSHLDFTMDVETWSS